MAVTLNNTAVGIAESGGASETDNTITMTVEGASIGMVMKLIGSVVSFKIELASLTMTSENSLLYDWFLANPLPAAFRPATDVSFPVLIEAPVGTPVVSVLVVYSGGIMEITKGLNGDYFADASTVRWNNDICGTYVVGAHS